MNPAALASTVRRRLGEYLRVFVLTQPSNLLTRERTTTTEERSNEYLDNFVRRPADRMAGRFHGFPCRRRIDSLVACVRSDFTDFAFRAGAARRVRADGHSIAAGVRCSGTRRTDRSQFSCRGVGPAGSKGRNDNEME